MNASSSDPLKREQQRIAGKLGIGGLTRHIFLCCDQTKDKCVGRARSLEAWDYLKVGNVEILSNAPEGTTRNFARDLGRFQAMLQVVSPAMLIRAERPVMVVLCGKGGNYQRFIETEE